ncbi:MAG: hypothetical protein FWE20_11965 [Defluviitaleaceae bacterium]|nr:hypothetical protein [Defluviitaleaceae bacterium]
MTPGVPAKPDFGFVGWTERTRSGTQGANDDEWHKISRQDSVPAYWIQVLNA